MQACQSIEAFGYIWHEMMRVLHSRGLCGPNTLILTERIVDILTGSSVLPSDASVGRAKFLPFCSRDQADTYRLACY